MIRTRGVARVQGQRDGAVVAVVEVQVRQRAPGVGARVEAACLARAASAASRAAPSVTLAGAMSIVTQSTRAWGRPSAAG